MLYYTLYNLLKDVDRKLHSGGASQTQDFFGAVDEARRNMIQKVRPPELIRKAYLEQALYDQVEKYAVPWDLKYDNVIELKKLASKYNVDTFNQPLQILYRRKFDQRRRGIRNIMAIVYENGVKYAKIRHPRGLKENQHLVIQDADSLTDNGTWNVGGNVTNLVLDKVNHITGHASLKFNINNSATTGFLENFTMDSVDLSDFIETGAVFTWLSVSIPKELTSVKLTLGSNTSNLSTDLYEFTVNQPHDNNEFITDWNLLKYPLKEMAQVGTPNPKAIAYVRLDFTTTGQAIPECRLDNIVARKGVLFEMQYNSTYCFMDAFTKVWKKYPTSNSDLIVAEEDTYQLLMLETAVIIQKEIYQITGGAKSDVSDLEDELKMKYREYAIEHKSEAIEDTDSSFIFGDYIYDGLTDAPIQDDRYNEEVD